MVTTTGMDNRCQPLFRGSRQRTALDADTSLSLLASDIRRSILRYLAGTPEQSVELADVHDHLHERMDLSRKEIVTRCRHVHLPKLEAEGLIEHDERSGVVRYRRNATVEALLDAIQRFER